MERRDRGGQNVLALLDAVNNGLPAEEAYSSLDQPNEKQISKNSNEKRPIRRVAHILSEIELVDGYDFMWDEERDNTQYGDLQVYLHDEVVSNVNVKVGSTYRQINEALLSQRKELGMTQGQYNNWLKDNRIIILMGRNSRESILNSFNDSFNRLKEHVLENEAR